MGIHRFARGAACLAVMGGLGMALGGAAMPAAGVAPTGGALSAPSGSRSAGTDRADTDLAALAQLWNRQADAWAKGDGNAYGATYTKDADFVNVTGEHLRGGPEIAVAFQGYLNAQLKNTRIHTLEEKIQLLSPTLAFIVRKGCVFSDTAKVCRPNTLSMNTSIVVKDSGRWLVRSFHNTLIAGWVEQRAAKKSASPAAGGLPSR
ncbi:SgcJ/EcaC family oxidoreductase [Sphaerisporangium flaviroseum]